MSSTTILFEENVKILIKTLTVSVCPKITKNELNDQLIIKHQNLAPKLQTCSELKCLKTLRIGSLYLSWESALPSTTLLSISVHLKRFQLSDLLSQLINLDNIFLDKLPAPPEFFSFLRACNIFLVNCQFSQITPSGCTL